MKDSSTIQPSQITPQTPEGTDRPRGAGEYSWQPGQWGTSGDLRAFFSNGAPRRVTVEENPASGRMCRELRQGGSSMVPGFSDWSGRWIKVVPVLSA